MPSARPRVLVVAYSYPPETKAAARRPAQLSRYLPDHGWDVSVACARPADGSVRDDPTCVDVGRGRLGEWLRAVLPADERPLFEQWTGTSSEGLDAPGASLASRLMRAMRGFIVPDEYAPWIANVVLGVLGDATARSADVVLATSPPYSCHVAAALLAKRLGVPFVLDYRDPYSLNAIASPGPLDRPLKEAMERWVAGGAAALTAVSEGYARRQSDFCGAEVLAIRNGWEAGDGRPVEPVEPPGTDGPLVVSHTGTIYPVAHDVDAFIQGAVDAVRAGVNLRIASCGSGGRFLREGFAPHGLEDRIDDAGQVSREEAVSMRAGSSAQLLFLPSRPEDDGTIPSKVFDYMATGRPVVAVGDPASEPGRILVQAGAGPAVMTPQEVSARLQELAAAQAADRMAPHCVPQEGAAAFSGRRMVAQFAEVLDAVLAESTVPSSQ